MDAHECASLSSRTDFAGYISRIREITGGDFSLVTQCRAEVCGALWGSGNPDISGIGMAIGYLLESIICMSLVGVYLLLVSSQRQRTEIVRLLLSNASKTFYDNAIFFTFAIQLASIITLSRANFGISADGMGAITMKMAWLVSTLTLLPLFPLVLQPALFSDGKRATAQEESLKVVAETIQTGEQRAYRESASPIAKARRGLRFLLFVLCWALSFYPFFSRMAGTFGESQIGNSPDSAISITDWNQIQDACFEGITAMSSRQEAVMAGFGIGSWLFVTVFVLYKIILSAMKGSHEEQWKWLNDRSLTLDSDTTIGFRIWLSVCALVTVFLVAQFWAFFRLQRFQADMIKAAGGNFTDGQWTFGQIVAVVLFMPVIVEVLFVWRRRSLYV